MTETLDELLAALMEVRAEIARGRELETELKDRIHEAAADMRRKFDRGPIRVELSSSINRRWDHDEVVKHVVARALDERTIDPDTGEVEPSFLAVARAIKECAGISYWRMGALRQRGLDPDEFAEITSRTPSVKLTPIVPEEDTP